ncbi:MAG TPA: tetratricopeptide repeat protein [Bryobacteraceae bacterium]|nr:tetratricopeptide repeat protein [Bryobacteraceae bacterium]
MKWLCILVLATPLSGAPLTFNRDVAPLVYQHCAPCHHAGGVGPFPLMTYSDVSRHASQIVDVTRRRYMPPWPPAHGQFQFAGDRSLSTAQIQLFAAWLAQGKPRGDPQDLPLPPRFTTEWQMGPPDLVLKMPKPYRMPAAGTDVFRNFIVPSGLTETKYVRGLELHLTNPRVVHHANVVLDRTQSLRHRDGEDGQPGFPGMDVITEAAPDNFDPDSHFLFWKPATVLRPQPEDMSWPLDPGTDLVLNLHLQPTGKAESVEVEIGLYFSSRAPSRFPMLLQLEHDGALHIPPGDRQFAVTDSLVLPVAVDLLAIYPHAHYLGKTIDAWATLPSGARLSLIHINDWDINWQAEYEYEDPIPLPEGTKVAMRITYDNSTGNPRNPNHPPKLVETGNRSQDEMGHVWLQVLPKHSQTGPADPRFALQEAIMRRRLEKYPADFVAHYNLAALEQTRGQLNQAAAAYRDALRIDPMSATAHNSLATVFMEQDRISEAIPELRAALQADPNYLNARYNLARCLADHGDLQQAAAEYKTFLDARPEDAAAQAALGTIYFKQRAVNAALLCFRKAAHLAPNDADVQANLGTLLAMTGDLPGAEQAFENALRLNPEHAAARANLARVRAQLGPRN